MVLKIQKNDRNNLFLYAIAQLGIILTLIAFDIFANIPFADWHINGESAEMLSMILIAFILFLLIPFMILVLGFGLYRGLYSKRSIVFKLSAIALFISNVILVVHKYASL